jgi:hypothetical protein
VSRLVLQVALPLFVSAAAAAAATVAILATATFINTAIATGAASLLQVRVRVSPNLRRGWFFVEIAIPVGK